MSIKILTTSMLLMLVSAAVSGTCRVKSSMSYNECKSDTGRDDNDVWWGYFDGNYSEVTGQGLGTGQPYPLTQNCAIKIERTNPEILGKTIKAVKFAFFRNELIEDVKIWMSTILPLVPEDADICCQTVDTSSLVDLYNDKADNEIYFSHPYLFGASDVYVGYSFTVTSDTDNINTFPVVVTDSETSVNGFFFDWGYGWRDYSGSMNGNLAVMLLLSNEGEFVPGDVNYDSQVNVGDLSSTIDYILGGNVNPFNKDMADIDGNAEINIVDAASIADMILGIYKTSNAGCQYERTDAVSAIENNGEIKVNLSAYNKYKAFQMDVLLPPGRRIISADVNGTLASTHMVRYSAVADDRYRVLVYPVSGECIDSGDNILSLHTDAVGEVKIKDIIFATSGLEEQRFDDMVIAGAASAENVCCDKTSRRVYSIDGIQADAATRGSGVYIINGKKTVVR